MAPVVGDGMRALMEFELPEFELPRIKKTGSGRDFDEAYKPLSSLFKVAAEKIVINALERLQEAQWRNNKLIKNLKPQNTNHRLTNNQNEDWTIRTNRLLVAAEMKAIFDKLGFILLGS